MSSKNLMPTSSITKNETRIFARVVGAVANLNGGYSPDQFSSEEEIINLLVSNKAIVDWWVHGLENIYYLRPKDHRYDFIAANWPPAGGVLT